MKEVNPFNPFLLRGYKFVEPHLVVDFSESGWLSSAQPWRRTLADDGSTKMEPLAHKTPDDIDDMLKQVVVEAVSKPRDEVREAATMMPLRD
jgi:hypothetical protein